MLTSFDVMNLVPNKPLKDRLELINKIMDSIIFLTKNHYCFNNISYSNKRTFDHWYTLSPLLAEICMNSLPSW